MLLSDWLIILITGNGPELGYFALVMYFDNEKWEFVMNYVLSSHCRPEHVDEVESSEYVKIVYIPILYGSTVHGHSSFLWDKILVKIS